MSVQEIFSRALPEYLAIGMPYELFWEGDVWLVVAFRKANRIRRDQVNFDAYLHGSYIYDALVRVAPALRAFNKNPKPVDWIDRPYDLKYSDQAETIDDEQPTAGEAQGISFMLNYMSAHNATRHQAEGKEGTA